ncbi:AI-2E family transporter [Amycolatopsis sp. cmx-4-83]|uniref:AI-2E family transporter n=1 Tax=Amycolatopsis sp. cmx-4-83 TaxID=2790940 RepID=UPI00397DB407
MAAAAGVAVTYGLIRLLAGAEQILVLVGLALFVTIGAEPAVPWLVAHRFPRRLSVTTVFVEQSAALVRQAPDHNTFLGRLDERFHLQQAIESMLSSDGGFTSGVLGVCEPLFEALTGMRATFHRLVPHSRRPRAILIGDNLFAKVGGYVLGNVAVSVIAGFVTLVWLLIFGVPYAAPPTIAVAVLDLIPVIGSVIGGALVSLVALTVSLPVCLVRAGFFVVDWLVEDYLLVPKVIGNVLKVPALATVAAAILLLVEEVL